ncbi:hypothetical protein F5Y09DRAFT_242135 [Xylaria sp. FL1042]|nr:hypothetical protein F5Y09DRAFT_242135 [Xylaria sp. FL1042]
MAIQDDPPSKSKTSLSLGGFPARFRSLVHEMKGLKKDFPRHRRGTKSEEVRPKQPLASSTELIPTSRGNASVPETRSLFRDSPHVRSLSIRVTVKFGEPLNYAHSQDYEGSSSLLPTEELCEALIRRVDHCSKELITRKDSSALDRTGNDGQAKPQRYEIQVQLLRNEMGTGTEAWASRTLRSYQKQPLTTEAARDVILSTHYMVGLFLRHHDEAFVWKDGPVREDPIQEHNTFPYQPGRVQPLTSIPRSCFIEKQQDFESIPGYTVRFSFTSQNHHRTPSHWHDTVEVNSRQLSPLTLASAENLFLDACYAVDDVFKSERKEFESLQKSCASHSGCQHCRAHDGDGIEMLVSVKNNMGPLFDNLERTTWARVNVFWKDRGTDCLEFVKKAKTAVEQVVVDTDESISQKNDFEFYIVELRGRGWTIDEPLAFTLSPDTCLCQQTVESLLDRLQTGVGDVLRGNAISVRMTARKRGHFILHKTLVARDSLEKSGRKKKSSGKAKEYVLDRLKQRIERDIEMVCKDTCTIVNRDIDATKLNRAASAPPQEFASTNDLMGSTRSSDPGTPSKGPTSNEQDQPADRPGSRGSELLETPVETPELSGASSSIPQHQWAKVARDPTTGARLFPLVPGRHSPHEMAATSSSESPTRRNKLSQNSTTETSFDLTTSYEQSNTITTQTTSDSSTSTTEQESTGTSLTDSHKYGRQRPTTAGSVVSTTPRTPDLEFSNSPSIRSSILMTPSIHEPLPNNEVAVVQKSATEVEGGELDGNGKVNSFLKRLYTHRAPSSRLGSRDGSVTSELSEARPMVREQDLDNTGSEGTSSLETETSSPSKGQTKASSGVKSTSDTMPIEPILEQDTPTEEASLPAPRPEAEAEVEVFSQSKPEFDFSSPLTITPPEGNEAIEESLPPTDKVSIAISLSKPEDTTSPDPAEEDYADSVASSSPPARPEISVLQHRKSFGSAGYLGSFQESRFYGVGLRQALVGPSSPPSRPLSRLGFPESELN